MRFKNEDIIDRVAESTKGKIIYTKKGVLLLSIFSERLNDILVIHIC